MTNADSTNPDFPEYDWSAAEKSYIISSFFWGYIFTQFLGGYLCKLFGVKRVMLWATFSSGVCSAVTPPMIYWGGWGAYCGIRVIMGCAQGVIFPSMHQHLARWSPPEERNRLGALSYTGIECGNVLSMFVSGMIARSPMGWPGISYISAVVAFACCILWIVFGANNVTESRFIGQAEKHYINSSLQHGSNYHKAIIPIPWRAIWTSVPFLALVVTRCAAIYGLSTLQAEIPAYMNGVLQMDIKENALFSALPFVASWALSYVYLIAADILLAKNWLSLTAIRKTMNSFAFWLPAATLIGIGFLDVDQKTLAIVLMTLSVGFSSGTTIGSAINTIDLSANHASILMGIVNTVTCVMSVITPLIAGVIVTDKTDRSQWQIVFIITSVIFIVFNCIYVAFGTAKSQPWNAEDFLLGPHLELTKSESTTKERGFTANIRGPQLPTAEAVFKRLQMSTQRASNPRANVFLLVNLGCEALFVIDQRLKAQEIALDKSVQVIHDVTSVLLEPKFMESLINGSVHSNAQLLTAEHCKFMLNDIATCSLMRLDETSMDKLWNLMTMVYKWQLFVSRHQHNLLDITFRHLDAVNKMYPDAKRHMLIDFSKNTLLDFWNSCGEEQQLSIYRTNKAWLECFNTKISLLIRLGFQAMDGSFINALDQSHYLDYVKCIGDNIYTKSSEQQKERERDREPNRIDQLAAQLNINQGEDLQPIDAVQFQKQFEQTFSHTLFPELDNNQAQPNASGCEFVQLLASDPGNPNPNELVTTASGNATGLNQQLLDLYSKIN
ncbi:hypothetical protein ACLKA7_000364 [Drosophila subpalustris]